MFCEKCGTDNRDNATTCSHCGEKMPNTSSCGGFGDILSYEAKVPSSSSSASSAAPVSSDRYAAEIRRLADENAQLTKAINLISQRLMIALGVAAVALAVALFVLITKPSADDLDSSVASSKVSISKDIEGIDSAISDLEERLNSIEKKNDTEDSSDNNSDSDSITVPDGQEGKSIFDTATKE